MKPDTDVVPPPTNRALFRCYQMCMHQVFEVIIYVLIFINVVAVLYEFIAETTLCPAVFDAIYGDIFKITNYVFIVFYIWEAIVKVRAMLNI